MTSAQQSDPGSQWRLDDPGDHHDLAAEPAAPPIAPPRDLSHERLERAVHVVTVEHLAWAAIALYATLTRFVGLGARPLDPVEAGHALFAFAVASPGMHASASYDPAYAGWIHLLTAALFAVAGANDFTARGVFALSGLVLIAIAFRLRPLLGRAGALALAAMLTLSPSVTWFSRSSATAIPAAALSLVTLAAFMDLKARPGVRRAIALGLAAGLMVAADPVGLLTAAVFVAALIPLGLWDLATRKHVGLSIRVWFDRYGSLPAIVMAAALATCALSQWMVPGGWDFDRIGRGASQLTGGPQPIFATAALAAGLRCYLPLTTLYEFMIAIAGLCGALAIIALRIRSRFAAWCLIWMVASIAFWIWTPYRPADAILALLLPAAVVGAIGLDWLHRRDSWRRLRWPLAVIAAMTLYVGGVANFIWPAPDASEAPWARHANLFWGAPATTEQTRLYVREAAAGISPADATVYFDGAVALPLRWYLRDLRPVSRAAAATVIVSNAPAPQPPVTQSPEAQSSAPELSVIYHFDYAEGWLPSFARARSSQVVDFLLRGRLWGPITTAGATIVVRKSPIAPTVLLSPRDAGRSASAQARSATPLALASSPIPLAVLSSPSRQP